MFILHVRFFMVSSFAKLQSVLEVSRTSSFETWSRTSASHGIKLIANLGFYTPAFKFAFYCFQVSFFEVKSRII